MTKDLDINDRRVLQALRTDAESQLACAGRSQSWADAYREFALAVDRLDAMWARVEIGQAHIVRSEPLAQAEAKPAPEPVAYAEKIAFEYAMKRGKGCDVWPKAGNTDKALIALYAAPVAPAQVPERLTDAFRERGLLVPSSLDEAIKTAANVLCEDGTIIRHMEAKLAAPAAPAPEDEDLNRKFMREINGPTFMLEPAQHPDAKDAERAAFEKLADDYASAAAKARLEGLYGTSKRYTRECQREENEARAELMAWFDGAAVAQAEAKAMPAPAPMARTLRSERLRGASWSGDPELDENLVDDRDE
jgi:hypothetical protein